MINRMGGIARVSMAPASAFDAIPSIARRVSCVLKDGQDWTPLPLRQFASEDDDSPESGDDGLLDSHSLRIPIYPDDERLVTMLYSALTQGCILRITFTSGVTSILGNLRWPVYGTLMRRSGQTPSEPYHYELSCTCHSALRELVL